MLSRWDFALAIAELRPGTDSFTRLISVFEPHRITAFCSYPIEGGCLWIPLLVSGKTCLGPPFLSPSELTRIVRRALACNCAGAAVTDVPVMKATPMTPPKAIREEVVLRAKAG